MIAIETSCVLPLGRQRKEILRRPESLLAACEKIINLPFGFFAIFNGDIKPGFFKILICIIQAYRNAAL